MISKSKFAQELTNYATLLTNNIGFTAFEGYNTPKGATVNMKVNHKGQLIVTKAKTFEKEVSNLKGKLKDAENELKQAKKTASTQKTKIEDLTTQLKEAQTIPEEVDEVKPKKKAEKKTK